MIYTSQYNISIQKTIGRLLPYWARGRNLFYTLCGSLEPLKSVHDSFVSWAQDKHFMARLTFQKMSMEWYMTKMTKQYFNDASDKVHIDLFAHKVYDFWIDFISNKDKGFHSGNYLYNKSENVTQTDNFMYYRDEVTGSTVNRFNILAPYPKTGVDIEQYTNEIKKIIATYSLIRRFKIVINNR